MKKRISIVLAAAALVWAGGLAQAGAADAAGGPWACIAVDVVNVGACVDDPLDWLR